MKIYTNVKIIVFLLVISSVAVRAQDVDINIIPQENSAVDGSWPQDAPAGTTAILVTVCNNDGGSTAVPSYKLRPLISVPGTIVQLAPDAEQTGLPAGWTIISNTGSSIRLSNGTDQIPAAECRDIILYVIPIAQGGPLTVTATMSFSNGVAPGSSVGPQTAGNNTANDNSTTTIEVTLPLPVTLVSFEATKESQTALLAWATTEETNSDRFDIQRSGNGKDWTEIGSVTSHHESKTLQKYQFTDQQPLQGENLYRLKMVDLDNSFAYSHIENANFGNVGEDLSVYPNPASGEVIVRNFSQVSQVSITDLGGRKVYQSGPLLAPVIDVNKLPSGMYTVVVNRKNGVSSAQKIMVVR